jgi:hypothetical protein
MSWKSCKEPWPRHSNKEWRITLKFAREQGWYLLRATGAYGHVRCGPSRSETCGFVVYSSGGGTEGIARQMRRMLKNCPHREPTDLVSL